MISVIGIISLGLVLASAVVCLFFCNIALAPSVVRRVAGLARFVGPESGKKLVRFW